MKPAKNQKKIPSSFFFMAPVTPQTHQCFLVSGRENHLKLYRGVGVGERTDGQTEVPLLGSGNPNVGCERGMRTGYRH